MKKIFLSLCCFVVLSTASIAFSSFLNPPKTEISSLRFPWQKAGLSQREAAAHLLNRFSFGPRQGQIDEVVNTGIEKWFEQQLLSSFSDDSVNQMLAGYESLRMTNEQIVVHLLWSATH